MADSPRFYLTTAIDYPNSRPHIGTAFEKIGADVQARYRRMEGYDVFFLMGNDENTIKVAKRAAELQRSPQEYCDDMAHQFKDVWRAFRSASTTSSRRASPAITKAAGSSSRKSSTTAISTRDPTRGFTARAARHSRPRRSWTSRAAVRSTCRCPCDAPSPATSSRCRRFQDQLLRYYEANPDFIQPESRRNEVLAFVQSGLQDVNITRSGQSWGIRVPFDEAFTSWVWFDALLNYITAIGYGADEERFRKWWPANIHFIGKDITRFHCAIWPAMLFAAGVEPPRMVFGHGFVNIKGEKISKTLGNIVEPMEIITKFSSEAFRYYFLRECPFPGDGEFSWQRFEAVYNSDLAHNLGNLYSRVAGLITQNYASHLHQTAGVEPGVIYTEMDTETTVLQVQKHVEACEYHLALKRIWQQILDPTNQYVESMKPWQLVKTDKETAKRVLYDLAEQLRVAAILIKPFLPATGETIYKSFNFPQPWETVRHEDVWGHPRQVEDLRVLAPLENGKVKPLFPRIS